MSELYINPSELDMNQDLLDEGLVGCFFPIGHLPPWSVRGDVRRVRYIQLSTLYQLSKSWPSCDLFRCSYLHTTPACEARNVGRDWDSSVSSPKAG